MFVEKRMSFILKQKLHASFELFSNTTVELAKLPVELAMSFYFHDPFCIGINFLDRPSAP